MAYLTCAEDRQLSELCDRARFLSVVYPELTVIVYEQWNCGHIVGHQLAVRDGEIGVDGYVIAKYRAGNKEFSTIVTKEVREVTYSHRE